MTRDEQLVFCKKCTNRKMDLQQGLLCGLTGKLAAFDGECPDFKRDEKVQDPPQYEGEPERGFVLPKEVLAHHDDNVVEEFRQHQDLTFALIGGALAALVSALLWAVVTVSTGYQIGYMAIAVGLIAGFAVRYFGAGIDLIYGVIGALVALFGCLLGNIFSQVAFAADVQQMGYFEALGYIDRVYLQEVLAESFSGFDLFFYALAVYEGYKFAFRPITDEMIVNQAYEPAGARYRLPLVGVSFALVAMFVFMANRNVDGYQTFYYESGEVMSKGNLVDGVEDGPWEFYNEDGSLALAANFKQGAMHGTWKWYDETGNLQQHQTFMRGLQHGLTMEYHPNSMLLDSGSYEHGRKTGPWIGRHDNGTLRATGTMQLDLQVGLWKFYYANGTMESQGAYDKGELIDTWTTWDSTGNKLMEEKYIKEGSLVQNAWDPQGNQIVKDGTGGFQRFSNSGQLLETGRVENGIRVGLWKENHETGVQSLEGTYANHDFIMNNAWSMDGEQMVTDGIGAYKHYDPETNVLLFEGSYSDGLKSGTWQSYYQSGEVQETFYFENGKLNGPSTAFYETGEVQATGRFQDNEKHGEWTWKYPGGGLETVVNYVNGLKEGDQIFWSTTGEETKIETYKEGELEDSKIL